MSARKTFDDVFGKKPAVPKTETRASETFDSVFGKKTKLERKTEEAIVPVAPFVPPAVNEPVPIEPVPRRRTPARAEPRVRIVREREEVTVMQGMLSDMTDLVDGVMADSDTSMDTATDGDRKRKTNRPNTPVINVSLYHEKLKEKVSARLDRIAEKWNVKKE